MTDGVTSHAKPNESCLVRTERVFMIIEFDRLNT